MEEYARFGIRFYWLVDPQQRTVDIYEQGVERSYTRRVEAGSGSLQDVPGCPGLTLDLDAMWSKIDALEEE
jgi:Uma2 family endonuclease